MLKAIIFDFDGVIANSEPLHFRAFRDVLAGVGVELSEQEYYGRYLGYDDVGVFKAVAADRGAAWDLPHIAALVSVKAERMEVLEREGSILFPGAEAAVRCAAAAVPIAIASGALGAEIRRILDRSGLGRLFAAVVAAEDTPVSKPAPEPYLLAIHKLAAAIRLPLAPHDIVAIEDSPWGLQSAKSAGLRTIAVAQTYDPQTLEADLVIRTMEEFDMAAVTRLCTEQR
jgi:beta-phosphoglucomutase-like phosphatase (HAD superfamily)